MCNFGSRAVWRNFIRAVGSYLDVDTRIYQYRLLNPTPLDCITGYIIEDSVGDRSLKRLPLIRLNLIYGYISSYWYIINSPEQIDFIEQENHLASVLGDIETKRPG